MSKKRLIFSTFIWLSLITCSSFAQKLKIKFGTSVYPPFVTLDKNQEPSGFDIELAKLICKNLSAECTFKNETFQQLTPSLTANKYDVWIGAITINKNYQRQELLFTKPYFFSTTKLIATKKNLFGGAPNEIKGKKIGILAETCYPELIRKTYGSSVTIKIYDSYEKLYRALQNGDCDAVMDDELVIRNWRSRQANRSTYRLIGLPAKYKNLVWHKFGIAVAKQHPELVKILNHAISKIKRTSNYKKLINNYLNQ